MPRLKYIVIDGVMPVLFSETLTHRDVAAIARTKDKPVTGAGFVSITRVPGGPESVTAEVWRASVYGHSTSLDKGPDEQMDQFIIERMLNEG